MIKLYFKESSGDDGYELYDSREGLIKVYKGAYGHRYYLDIDNKYDKEFDLKSEYDAFMKRVGASYIGWDHD